MSRNATAFTLIELLVVTTLLVILMAILTPALDSAMRSAQVVFCASNEQAIGVGLTQWLMSHDRRFPAVPNYGTLLGRRGSSAHYGSGDRGVAERPLNVYLGYQGEDSDVLVARCPSDRGDSLSYENTDYTPTDNAYNGYGSSYIEAFGVEGWGVKPVFGQIGPSDTPAPKPSAPVAVANAVDKVLVPAWPSMKYTQIARTDNKILLGDWPFYGDRNIHSELTRWHSEGDRKLNLLFADFHAEYYLFPDRAMENPFNSTRKGDPSFFWW